MLDLSSAPPSLLRLAESLANKGTPLVQLNFDSGNNQRLRALTSLGTVQVLADRGQWFVELAPPGADDFFDSTTWDVCLHGAEISLEVVPLDTQVAWLEAVLDKGMPGAYTLECLLEARRRQAYGGLGLTP